ncbi:uncharacterized protein [Blastocystis hominis]|uniref:Uncharacterized protein n=1 Tax=Blastocystis hominis TaxID=12968 RepID=D8M0S2_BLAHO|nr:uncharacterized protein [Blastocystis hominis]CBK21661.2 unnamed protein product [Blastocystis hominis]|eukprot:XP_012895709.1 uncharacterized protein [Blastocystis hominis]
MQGRVLGTAVRGVPVVQWTRPVQRWNRRNGAVRVRGKLGSARELRGLHRGVLGRGVHGRMPAERGRIDLLGTWEVQRQGLRKWAMHLRERNGGNQVRYEEGGRQVLAVLLRTARSLR